MAKLSDFKFGTIVQNKESKEIGMVKGVTNSVYNYLSEEQRDPSRAILLVEWQSRRTTGIHPSHIEIYKG